MSMVIRLGDPVKCGNIKRVSTRGFEIAVVPVVKVSWEVECLPVGLKWDLNILWPPLT